MLDNNINGNNNNSQPTYIINGPVYNINVYLGNQPPQQDGKKPEPIKEKKPLMDRLKAWLGLGDSAVDFIKKLFLLIVTLMTTVHAASMSTHQFINKLSSF